MFWKCKHCLFHAWHPFMVGIIQRIYNADSMVFIIFTYLLLYKQFQFFSQTSLVSQSNECFICMCTTSHVKPDAYWLFCLYALLKSPNKTNLSYSNCFVGRVDNRFCCTRPISINDLVLNTKTLLMNSWISWSAYKVTSSS